MRFIRKLVSYCAPMQISMVKRRFLSIGGGKEDALSHCIETIKKDYPLWAPKYAFFRIQPSEY